MYQRPLFIALIGTCLGAPVQADDKSAQFIEDFVLPYHSRPAPERVPEALDLILRERDFTSGYLRDLGGRRFVTFSLGLMGRGHPEVVRKIESRFRDSNADGKAIVLETLKYCGDRSTLKLLQTWSSDPAYGGLRETIEATRTFLTDPKRQLPRDRPAKDQEDINLLWADFFVTGEYAPVARILDVLDRPGKLRASLVDLLKKAPDLAHTPEKLKLAGINREHILELLTDAGLIERGTADKLVSGTLELVLIHDGKGLISGKNLDIAAALLDSETQVIDDLSLRWQASDMLQMNLEQCARLVELLKQHYKERPAGSQDLLRKWLRIEQMDLALGAEARRLQGSWQATSWDEDGDTDDARTRMAMLKFNRWKFVDDELDRRGARTITTNGVVEVLGNGCTFVVRYKIDSSKRPKVITMFNEQGIQTEEVIYEINGDSLRICAKKGGTRPGEFSAKAGTEQVVLTLKRIRPR